MNGAEKAAGFRNLGIDDQRAAQDLDGLLLAAVTAAQSQVGGHTPAVEHEGVGITSELLGYRGLGNRCAIAKCLAKRRQGRLDCGCGSAVLAPDAGRFHGFRCAARSRDPNCDRDLPIWSAREFAAHCPARGERWRVAKQRLAAHELERRQVAKPFGHQRWQSRFQVVESAKAVAVLERLDHKCLARSARLILRGRCRARRADEKGDSCHAPRGCAAGEPAHGPILGASRRSASFPRVLDGILLKC